MCKLAAKMKTAAPPLVVTHLAAFLESAAAKPPTTNCYHPPFITPLPADDVECGRQTHLQPLLSHALYHTPYTAVYHSVIRLHKSPKKHPLDHRGTPYITPPEYNTPDNSEEPDVGVGADVSRSKRSGGGVCVCENIINIQNPSIA